MPCIKCSNGKWKYGQHGRCQFDTLASCKAAEAAIHARENKTDNSSPLVTKGDCGNCGGCENCPCREDCKNRS